MKMTQHFRKILSALLVIVLVFSMMPVPASAAGVVDAAVIFSDLHTSKSNYKESTLKGIMTAIKNAGLPVSHVISAGDAFSVNDDSGKYTGYTSTLTGYIQAVLGNVPVHYVWSDHDRYAVQADGSTLLSNDSGFVYGAGNDGVYGTDDDANYYIFSLSMADLSTNNRYNADFHTNSEVTAAIKAFSNTAKTLKKDRPLIVASHQPLLDRRNDNGHALEWCNAINTVAEEMDVAFFFGHNHRYDVAGDYYYAKGSTMSVCKDSSGNAQNVQLNFTHMCAGYMEPTSTSSYSSTTRKGVAVAIIIYEDAINYVTYDANGIYTGNYALNVTVPRDFAAAGGTEEPTVPETNPTEPAVTEPEVTEPETEPTQPEVTEEGAIWRRATSITNGKKYLLVNYGYNASGVGTYAVNSNAGATEVEVLTDATGAYIVSDDQSLTWIAKANNGQFEMANAENGKYLRAANYVYGTSGSDITVNSSTTSGSTYTNWSMETKSSKTILAVRRATSGNYYPVRYTGSAFQAFNSSQVSSQNNWLAIFEETDERAAHEHIYETVTIEATCTEAGSVTSTCTVCGESTVEVIEAKGHSYECVVTDATCGKDGSKVYTCSACNDTYTEVIPATGNHTNETVTVDATCTEVGSVTTTCTVCGEESVEVIEAKGHSYECVVTDATCGQAGSKVYTCSACDDTYTETIPATENHSYTVETLDATCTEAGSTTYICTVCGHSYVDVIAAIGHSYTGTVTAPTCTENGCTTYTCDTCGHSYVGEETPATGHTYDTVVSATCTEDGFEVHTCKICGHSYNGEAVAAFGHSYETTTVAPTCATTGYTTYVCTTCGDTYTGDEVAALGHSYTGETVNATCTEGGYTTYTCGVCGHSYVGDEMAALGHDYESVVTAPTFETEGYTTHTCRVCGDVKVDSFVPVLSHTYETVTTEATCTEDGSIVHTCVDCGYSYTEVLAAPGHSYETVTTEATCETDGSVVSTCSVCGNVETSLIPATGHSYETTVIAPTCTASGFTTYTCACGSVVTEEIPALGHSYESRYTAPTCTVSGGTTYTCTVCGDTYTEAEAALGHAYESCSVAPTCTAAGYTTYTCTVCADSYTADQIPALGHSYGETVTAPTCTEAGYTTYTCTVCGDTYTGNPVSALGHSYSGVESDGYMVYTCDRCGDSYSEKLGFTYTKVSSIASDNRYVITLVSGNKYYALSHEGNAIAAVRINVSNDEITSEITEDLIWNYTDSKLSYVSGGTTYYLYAQSNNWWGNWWGWWGNWWNNTPTLTLSTGSSTNVTYSGNQLKMDNYYLNYSNNTVSLSSSATTACCFLEQ